MLAAISVQIEEQNPGGLTAGPDLLTDCTQPAVRADSPYSYMEQANWMNTQTSAFDELCQKEQVPRSVPGTQ